VETINLKFESESCKQVSIARILVSVFAAEILNYFQSCWNLIHI
jgi:hypothetical protein